MCEESLGIETDIGAQLMQAVLPGRLLDMREQPSAHALASMLRGHKKVIDIAIGLQICIGHGLIIVASGDKGLERLNALTPLCPVRSLRRPGVQLLLAVVVRSQLVHRIVEHLPQRDFISGTIAAYMHGLAD